MAAVVSFKSVIFLTNLANKYNSEERFLLNKNDMYHLVITHGNQEV